MAQRARQPAANLARAKGSAQSPPMAVEPQPPRKRLWFLLITAAALLVWAAFLVAMALQ